MNLSHGYLAFCSQNIQRGKGGFLLGSKGLRTYKKKGGSSRRGVENVKCELAYQNGWREMSERDQTQCLSCLYHSFCH